ncbi:hypothetical protein [Pseudomonas sp. B10(2017)]|uniref:hypothetical protein n=1 Tax=Pseudomonas sp. B10(2017) TaxID=1981749 RepID=UPI000A1DD30C|nr:hypothetical protein [Pseudomonas sp. B10(2017)]
MSESIQVEPIDGPDEAVPIDGLAANLTDSVGVPNDAGVDDLMPDDLASEVEDHQAMTDRRYGHLAEQEADQVDEQVEQQPQGRKHVPLGALQQERALHQQAKEQVRLLQEQLAAHQAQMQQFQQWQQQLAAQQQQAQQQADIPAFVDDPEGHINALKAQFEQRLNDMQGQQQATVHRQQLEQAAVQVQRDAQEVEPFVRQLEPKFRAAHPDYDDAREFVHANIRSQLAVQYPGATLAEIQGLENVATVGFLRHCQANGIDPCAYVYQRAQALGFQSQHRAPATPAKRAPTSLGALPGGGRAPDEQGRLSASQVASMSNEDFDRLFEQMRANDAPRFGF